MNVLDFGQDSQEWLEKKGEIETEIPTEVIECGCQHKAQTRD